MKNMKYIGMLAGAILASTVALQQAQATPLPLISGSISFSGIATVNNAVLANATSFTSIQGGVADDSGAYAVIPHSIFGPTVIVKDALSGGTATGGTIASPGLMSLYTFNPAQASITPLWSFDYLGVNYSFNATSVTASFNATLNIWNIGGSGLAHIGGYQDTYGTWNAGVGASGTSFWFGSSAAVPDGGLTVALLGGALVALQAFRRKLLK